MADAVCTCGAVKEIAGYGGCLCGLTLAEWVRICQQEEEES